MQRDHSACYETLEQFLVQSLRPLIAEGLRSIQSQAEDIGKSRGLSAPELTLQLLEDVKDWSQMLLNEEAKRVESRIPFLQKLLTALFVMRVKVLSSIQMSSNAEDFPLSIPSTPTFLHHVYTHAARLILHESPNLIEIKLTALHPTLRNLVDEAIRLAIHDLIEWDKFFHWGLGDVDAMSFLRKTIHGEVHEAQEPDDDESDHKSVVADVEDDENAGEDAEAETIESETFPETLAHEPPEPATTLAPAPPPASFW